MKKVLVLNPPSPDETYINRDLMGGMGAHNPKGHGIRAKILFKIKSITVHIPFMQLVNAATLLKKEGYALKVIDAVNIGKGLEYCIQKARDFQPDFILMGVSSGCFRYERDEVARKLKESLPNVKIIAVGDMITEMPNELLPWFDVAIMGEIEQSILLICAGKPFKEIPSIIWQENKEVKTSEGGKRFIQPEELNNLPFPDWSLFPYKNYSYYPMLTKTPVAMIQASRGCPYGCGYCPYPANQGKIWRARSAESVFKELEWDYQKFGFKGFFFRDPLFTADQARASKLCDMILQSGMKIQFAFETRPELLSMPGLIEKLAKAGCRAINFGVEDIHPEVLKMIGRVPIPLETIAGTISKCEKAGIRATCFFIIGLPGSTRKSLAETINFSKKLMASQTEFKVATPFPGTLLYKMAKENNWITKEGFDNLGGYSATMKISDELPEKYLEELAETSVAGFYFNPRYLFRYFTRGDFLSTVDALMKAALRK